MFELRNKVAVVTGAASGIGAAMARLFAQQHARVVVLDLDETAAEKIVLAIRDAGGDAVAKQCDVSKPAEVTRVFGEIERVDILVNNAGITHIGSLETT